MLDYVNQINHGCLLSHVVSLLDVDLRFCFHFAVVFVRLEI